MEQEVAQCSPVPPPTSLAPSRTEALNPIAERAAKAQASIQRLSATSDANIEEAPNDEEFPAGGKDKNALEPILLKFS